MIDIITSIITILISTLLAVASSYSYPTLIYNFPALLIIGITSFLIHWLIFIPSFLTKTEKFYDITGTIAYLIITLIAISIPISNGQILTVRAIVVAALIIIWSLRLGLYLLIRVFQVGEDKRFKYAKTSFTKFLMYFTISAMWVFMTTVNAITVIINNSKQPLSIFFIMGFIIWLIGFFIEVLADEQKRKFRKDIANRGNFIQSGLWSISRHPNYFGEILIWIGMALISIPVLIGWQYLTLISPFFVTILLTKVSGINLLEEIAEKRWGDTEAYKIYKKNTPVLIPTFINIKFK